MSMFKLPLSGDVAQSINPYTWFMSPIGSQFGVINVAVGQSSDPSVEKEVLEDVAGYGKQLGRMGDALLVLMRRIPRDSLTQEEAEAFDALRDMLDEIAAVKARHQRPTLRP